MVIAKEATIIELDSSPGSLLLHAQLVTFELPLGREPGQIDHISDVEK